MMALASAAASIVLLTPSSAMAAYGCGSTAPDKDSQAYGKYFATSVNIRSGPYTSCAVRGVGYTSHTVDIHCYTNVYYNGRNWTYVRDVTTGVTGWVWDGNLNTVSYSLC
ncbi:hypothetical protein GCM10010405_59740 [Streptomyces macrosporus]|uniref:SH3 domain-containing protein n=1 Tax=Streptomyces macrosporus TaxID=44032 RepID=A0ABP5XZ09_9ACTN